MQNLKPMSLTIWFKNGTTATFHQVWNCKLYPDEVDSNDRVLDFYYYGQSVLRKRHATFKESDIAGHAYDIEDNIDQEFADEAKAFSTLLAGVADAAGHIGMDLLNQLDTNRSHEDIEKIAADAGVKDPKNVEILFNVAQKIKDIANHKKDEEPHKTSEQEQYSPDAAEEQPEHVDSTPLQNVPKEQALADEDSTPVDKDAEN